VIKVAAQRPQTCVLTTGTAQQKLLLNGPVCQSAGVAYNPIKVDILACSYVNSMHLTSLTLCVTSGLGHLLHMPVRVKKKAKHSDGPEKRKQLHMFDALLFVISTSFFFITYACSFTEPEAAATTAGTLMAKLAPLSVS
jgi:hypothetical protein